MDWIRENKTLAAIVGIMVAGGIGLGVLVFMAYSGYTESLDRFDTVNNGLAAIKGAKLYPNAANVDEKEKAVSEYEQAVSQLGGALLILQQKTEAISDTDFQAKLKAKIADTKKLAADYQSQLPGDFALTFDTYTSSLPRSGEAATVLSGYLDAVEAITRTAIEAGVKSIDTMERTELAIEKGAPPPEPAPSKKSTSSQASSRKGAKGAAPVKQVEVEKALERRTIKVTLTTDQGPLQVLLNKLATTKEMPFFTVVRQLRIENEKQEGPLKTAFTNPGIVVPDGSTGTGADGSAPAVQPVPADGAAQPEQPKRQIIEPAKPAAPDSIAVLGQEMLKVYLEIDIVQFLEPKAAE